MKFIKILILSAIFSSRIFACALCALYTPTAHVSITPVAQDGKIVSLHFSWLFSQNFTDVIMQTYDINSNGKLENSELAEITKAMTDYLTPKNYLCEAEFYDQAPKNAKPALSNLVGTQIKGNFKNAISLVKKGRLVFEFDQKVGFELRNNRVLKISINDDQGFFNFKMLDDKPINLGEGFVAKPNSNLATTFIEFSGEKPKLAEKKPSISSAPSSDLAQDGLASSQQSLASSEDKLAQGGQSKQPNMGSARRSNQRSVGDIISEATAQAQKNIAASDALAQINKAAKKDAQAKDNRQNSDRLGSENLEAAVKNGENAAAFLGDDSNLAQNEGDRSAAINFNDSANSAPSADKDTGQNLAAIRDNSLNSAHSTQNLATPPEESSLNLAQNSANKNGATSDSDEISSEQHKEVSLGFVAQKTMDFMKSLKTAFRASSEHASASTILWVLALSFIYGFFHAAGPGHAKLLTASYFLAHGGSYVKAFVFALKIGLLHVLGALVLVSASMFVLQNVAGLVSANSASITTKISALLIIVITALIIYDKARRVRSGAHHDAGCSCAACASAANTAETGAHLKNTAFTNAGNSAHAASKSYKFSKFKTPSGESAQYLDAENSGAAAAELNSDSNLAANLEENSSSQNKQKQASNSTNFKNQTSSRSLQNGATSGGERGREWLIALAAALVPCPGTILIFVLAFSLGSFALSVASALFIGFGMSVVIFLAALFGAKANELSSKRLVSLKLYVEFLGLFVMFGLGIFMYFLSDNLRVL